MIPMSIVWTPQGLARGQLTGNSSMAMRHKCLRAVQRQALRQAEHLFQSLLHRAFNREP